MKRKKILQKIKLTAFFRALTKDAQERLIKDWDTFPNKKIIKIMALALVERMMLKSIANSASTIFKTAKKEASTHLVKSIEKATRSKELANLEKILNDE